MKILIVQTASAKIQKIARRLKEKLQDCDKNITVELWEESRRQIACADIRQAQADLFITFNLAGFEQCTLTGGVAFNLLDCKQIHFLLDAKLGLLIQIDLFVIMMVVMAEKLGLQTKQVAVFQPLLNAVICV